MVTAVTIGDIKVLIAADKSRTLKNKKTIYKLREVKQSVYASTFLENWGSGIHRITEACQGQGVEESTLRWDGAFIYVTFKRPTKYDSSTTKVPNNLATSSPETEQVPQKSNIISNTVNDTAKLIFQTIADNLSITYQ